MQVAQTLIPPKQSNASPPMAYVKISHWRAPQYRPGSHPLRGASAALSSAVAVQR